MIQYNFNVLKIYVSRADNARIFAVERLIKKVLDAMLTPVFGPYGEHGRPAQPHAVVVKLTDTDLILVQMKTKNNVFVVTHLQDNTNRGDSGRNVREVVMAETDTAHERTLVDCKTK